MKTTAILNHNGTPDLIGLTSESIVKRLLPTLAGVLLTLCTIVRSEAQCPDGNCPTNRLALVIAHISADLFTAPLSTAQRQAIHANNFNQLSLSARPLYLQAVACELGAMIAHANPISATDLNEYLQNESLIAAGVQLTPAVLAFKAIVLDGMRQLNLLILGQVTGDPNFQQAMNAGAMDSTFWNGTDWAW